MITDKKEIESVLQIGEKILLDHPELYNMSLDEVLLNWMMEQSRCCTIDGE